MHRCPASAGRQGCSRPRSPLLALGVAGCGDSSSTSPTPTDTGTSGGEAADRRLGERRRHAAHDGGPQDPPRPDRRAGAPRRLLREGGARSPAAAHARRVHASPSSATRRWTRPTATAASCATSSSAARTSTSRSYARAPRRRTSSAANAAATQRDLLAAVDEARAAKRGYWGACPGRRLTRASARSRARVGSLGCRA